LNALAGESAAIVSPTPGTTRDYVRRRVTWDGLYVELLDTAGIEPDANDGISATAQRMTVEQIEGAHLVLLCLDSSRALNDWEREQLERKCGMQNAERGMKEEPTAPHSVLRTPHFLPVLTKSDLPRAFDPPVPYVAVSSVAGAGLDELRRRIAEAVAERFQETGVVTGTAVRCRESLRLAAECLSRAQETAAAGLGEELVAAEVRTALDELGKVAGQIYTEDVLDRIFSRFCIGK
jgi:tRNA modification GTPase